MIEFVPMSKDCKKAKYFGSADPVTAAVLKSVTPNRYKSSTAARSTSATLQA